jgi:hypothetical protein
VLVQPGVENTQWAVLTLDNATPIKIHQMRNVLGSASHHMIVYRDDASAPQGEPLDCQPFAGTLTATPFTSPIMVTQRHEETLTLPDASPILSARTRRSGSRCTSSTPPSSRR